MSEAVEPVVIAVDAMGGDDAPGVVLEGVEKALQDDPCLRVLLCGPQKTVEPFASAHVRCEPASASQVIGMGEHPARAVRTKKDSSIVVGCRAVKERHADGFFSAGSTGACLAAATLITGRLSGIKRPALAHVIPSYDQPCLLLDVGANVDCKPEYLVQFAKMGLIYARRILGVENPRVGMLNNGAEETKGSASAQESFRALSEQIPEFAGNCEGTDLLQGVFDVVVCDGFSGNICLKTMEGTSKVLFRYIKDAFMSSTKTKLAAAMLRSNLAEIKAKLDPDTYGGAPFLGIDGVCLVGHGASSSLAIENGILTAASTVRSGICEVIAQAVSSQADKPLPSMDGPV